MRCCMQIPRYDFRFLPSNFKRKLYLLPVFNFFSVYYMKCSFNLYMSYFFYFLFLVYFARVLFPSFSYVGRVNLTVFDVCHTVKLWTTRQRMMLVRSNQNHLCYCLCRAQLKHCRVSILDSCLVVSSTWFDYSKKYFSAYTIQFHTYKISYTLSLFFSDTTYAEIGISWNTSFSLCASHIQFWRLGQNIKRNVFRTCI